VLVLLPFVVLVLMLYKIIKEAHKYITFLVCIYPALYVKCRFVIIAGIPTLVVEHVCPTVASHPQSLLPKELNVSNISGLQ